MNEMVGRVARALRGVPYMVVADRMREQRREKDLPPPTSEEILATWTAIQARQAITAMRDPTEEMVAAAKPILRDQGFQVWPKPAESWRVMIDAALKEG